MSVFYKQRDIRALATATDGAYQTGTTVTTSAGALFLSANGDLVGMRFQNVQIPQGATVTASKFNCWIQNGTANLRVYCEDADSTSTFSTASNNIGARTKTTDYATWSAGITAGYQDSIDFSAPVQEVVNRPGWTSGSSIVILLENQSAASLTIISTPLSDVKLIVDFTMPEYGGRPRIDSIVTSSLRLTSSHSVSVPLPAAGGTRVFISVQALRRVDGGTFADQYFDYVSASFNGMSLTALYNEDHYAFASVMRHNFFEVVDPLGGGPPASHTFTVNYNKSVIIGITAIIVTGVTERGSLVDWNTTDEGGGATVTNMSVNVTTDKIPGLILAAGSTRQTAAGHTRIYAPAGDVTWLNATYATGTNNGNDLQCFVASVNAVSTDTYEAGVAWDLGDVGSIVALPIYGRVEVAEAEVSAEEPLVLYMSATLDGLMAEAEFSSPGDPDVVQGSIPPVQVSGRGQLYLSTSARNLTVMLLATSGDKWTLVDNGGDPEQLGLRITRRAGYLTPV